MTTTLLQLKDSAGQTCDISISFSRNVFGKNTGTWRVIEQGKLAVTGGTFTMSLNKSFGAPVFGIWDLRLIDSKNEWGLTLNKVLFNDAVFFLITNGGSGNIHQAWVLSFNPGNINWTEISS